MTKGIYFGILAAVSVAVMGVFVKLIETDQNNFTILFFRFIISLLIILPLILKDKNFSFKIKFPYSLSFWKYCSNPVYDFRNETN